MNPLIPLIVNTHRMVDGVLFTAPIAKSRSPFVFNKRTSAFIALLFSVQVWTLHFSAASVAIAGFLLISMLLPRPREIPKFFFILCLAALVSAIVSEVPRHPDIFQYTIWFSIATLVIWLAWVNWSINLRYLKPSNVIVWGCYASILFCFVGIALISPDALLSETNGEVGFFNEKGLAGYYLVSISCVLISLRRRRIDILTFLLIFFYALFVLKSGRCLCFYFAVILFVAEGLSSRFRFYLLLFLLSCLGFMLLSSFGGDQMYKLNQIAGGEGGAGRYAAALIISRLDSYDLLVGHGYGTYLSYRADLLPLEDGILYDYPGSLILELVFEIGLVATIGVIVIMTKFMLRKITAYRLFAVFFLCLFGAKQDVQMLSSLLFGQFIFQVLRTEKMQIK